MYRRPGSGLRLSSVCLGGVFFCRLSDATRGLNLFCLVYPARSGMCLCSPASLAGIGLFVRVPGLLITPEVRPESGCLDAATREASLTGGLRQRIGN